MRGARKHRHAGLQRQTANDRTRERMHDTMNVVGAIRLERMRPQVDAGRAIDQLRNDATSITAQFAVIE